ncbi:MAG TPA: hypothetical protein VHS06_11200 [Chloroflexota bacterium]|nr:hypothetical protein [Chloroflexota bacterium]
MLLTFERGDSQRPKGHALLYFRSWTDRSTVFATYLIVPPIAVELTKYIPPMFAGQFQQMGLGAGGISVFPYPPIPERVESHALLQRLAGARDDDLVDGGSVDASSPERLLQAASEAAAQYFQQFSSYMESVPTETAPEALPEEGSSSVDVNEILYGLMSERDRLAELAKLSGQLRYAVSSNDPSLLEETVAEVHRLAKFLPEKYRVEQVVKAAQRTGGQGDRLTQLYLDRAYKLIDEDYQAVKRIEDEIRGEEAA